MGRRRKTSRPSRSYKPSCLQPEAGLATESLSLQENTTSGLSLTHRELCYSTAVWLLSQSDIHLCAWELSFGKSVLDVVGLSIKGKLNKRICIAECKRSRADLTQDLRKQKLLKYEAQASHCYLAGTSEAFLLHKLTPSEVIQDLTDKGLPTHWGILYINSAGLVTVIRGARRHRPTPSQQLDALIRKCARKHMYISLNTLGLIDPI